MLKLLNTDLSKDLYVKILPKFTQLINTVLIAGKEDDVRLSISILCRLIYMLDKIPDELLLYYPLLCYIWLDRPTTNLQMYSVAC